MKFFKKNFGECEVICLFKDIAIIELEKNVEKYVVVIGMDYINRKWDKGYYFKYLKDAGETFNNILEGLYMVSFKI